MTPRGGGFLRLGILLALAMIGGGRATAAEAPGDATRGQAVFAAKQCVRCHASRGQPSAGPAAASGNHTIVFPSTWLDPDPTRAEIELAFEWWKKFPEAVLILSTEDNQPELLHCCP